ncbi:MAG: ABC transporter ATP-binding protein [Pseudomonadota bacterium]
MTAAIELQSLVKQFGDTRALDGVNLSVKRGGIFALLGRNGAGKSTAIHCALGLVKPDSGTATVLGNPAGSIAARRQIGVMLQEAHLPDNLTGREHLALFASYFPKPADLNALIDITGIGDFADKLYKKLSGGQKRRVQFAVSLVGQPDLLFLDEPTTGLDKDAREAVWNSIRTLAADGRTVVLTTHYLEEADALADRICIVNNGRVIAEDNADAIRQQVGGSLIRCQSELALADARSLPAVREGQRQGRWLTLLSDDANATLRSLLTEDPSMTDLTVNKPSLEEAFTALTNQHPEGHA